MSEVQIDAVVFSKPCRGGLQLLPRWRWFKRWRLTRMLKKLVDKELAYRGN